MNININGKDIELPEDALKIIAQQNGYFKTEHSAKKVIDNCEKELKILWDIN